MIPDWAKPTVVLVASVIWGIAIFTFMLVMLYGCGPSPDYSADSRGDSGISQSDSGVCSPTECPIAPHKAVDAGIKCVPKPDPEACHGKICNVGKDECGNICNCNRGCTWKVEPVCGTISHQCAGDCLCQKCAPFAVFCPRDVCTF
jgi:hypothetical protein